MLLQGPLIVMFVQCARGACVQLLNLIPNPGWIWDALHSATVLATWPSTVAQITVLAS